MEEQQNFIIVLSIVAIVAIASLLVSNNYFTTLNDNLVGHAIPPGTYPDRRPCIVGTEPKIYSPQTLLEQHRIDGAHVHADRTVALQKAFNSAVLDARIFINWIEKIHEKNAMTYCNQFKSTGGITGYPYGPNMCSSIPPSRGPTVTFTGVMKDGVHITDPFLEDSITINNKFIKPLIAHLSLVATIVQIPTGYYASFGQDLDLKLNPVPCQVIVYIKYKTKK